MGDIMKLKDLPLSERPRERLINYGVESISNEELLAIIIKTGTKNKSVKELASEVLSKINSLSYLEMININTFKDISGLGKVKTIELMATIELGKRIFLKKDNIKKINYNNPYHIYLENKYLFIGKKQEYFYCLYLDNRNNLIERKLLFIGTLNRSIVHPREIFREAYILYASKIICMHNHPSGDVNPSIEDIRLTKALIEIGKIEGIELADHIIISDNNYYSFYSNKKELFI
jgi:DNA repair protein RadC